MAWHAPLSGHHHFRAYIVLGDDRVFVQRAEFVDCFSLDGTRLWSFRGANAQQMAAIGVPDMVRNDPRT